MFVNRVRELQFLENRFASDQAELVVLYGRRRVGKTELLRTFCSGKPHVFFVADLGTEAGQLAELTRRIGDFVAGDPGLLAPFTTWEAAFNYLAGQAPERLVVVLDEFTYLIDVNGALPSIFQRMWDTVLQNTNLMLVLCGSYVGMVEQEVLSYRSPLYGRRTGQWRLHPLSYWDASKMLPRFGVDDMVRAYAILGGVPAYLRLFDDRQTLLRNVEDEILTQGQFLYDEPRFLLLQELREPSRYFAVLEAIASGRTRLNEIALATKIAPTSVSFYLKTLQEMGLVNRVVPATETSPDNGRWGIHQLADNYFRFWFRLVYPNRSLLERGETTQVMSRVREQLDQFVGPAFETVCQESIWRAHGAASKAFELGFTPSVVGRWWNRQKEIDVVAVGEGKALLGECKWSQKAVGLNLLDELQQKAQSLVDMQGWESVRYALFSRSGFTAALKKRAQAEDVLLVDLQQLADL